MKKADYLTPKSSTKTRSLNFRVDTDTADRIDTLRRLAAGQGVNINVSKYLEMQLQKLLLKLEKDFGDSESKPKTNNVTTITTPAPTSSITA